MTTYCCEYKDLEGCAFYIRADFSQASSQIEFSYGNWDDPEDWQRSQFQVSDSQHDPETAAELIEEHASCADPDDQGEIGSVQPMPGVDE